MMASYTDHHREHLKVRRWLYDRPMHGRGLK